MDIPRLGLALLVRPQLPWEGRGHGEEVQVSLRHTSVQAVLWLGHGLPCSRACPSLPAAHRERGVSWGPEHPHPNESGSASGQRILDSGGDSRLSLSRGMGQGSSKTQRNMGIVDGRAEAAGTTAMLLTIHTHLCTVLWPSSLHLSNMKDRCLEAEASPCTSWGFLPS